MADPLTTLDLVVVGAVVVALAGAIAALWFAFRAGSESSDKLKTELLQKMLADQEDLVKRVRSLEEARFSELRGYATKMEARDNRVLTVFDRVVTVLQDLASAVKEANKRPCIAEARDRDGKRLDPTPVPEVETEVLLAQEERLKRRRQEESAGP